MRYSPRELKTLAEHYGKTINGTDHSGVKMEARRCPICAQYEVVDVDACEADRHHESVIIKCKCDE